MDAPLAGHRVELLELGFAAASSMPVEGHGKTRSREQAAVVQACLDLDQPRRALAFAHQIEDWRRGAAYADFAFYCATAGSPSEGLEYLAAAEAIAESDPLALAQEWRRDRILVKIARTHELLGNQQEAGRLVRGTVDSEAGKIDAVRASRLPAAAFDEYLAGLDALLQTGSFDRVRHGLEVCVELHERFYTDSQRRALLEDRVRTSYAKLPLMIRIDLVEQLVRTALRHGEPVHALELVEVVEVMVDSTMWSPEYRIPLLARLASMRGAAGDLAGARLTADEAWKTFLEHQGEIVSIFRCEALLPLAAAYHQIGAKDLALMVYGRALAEGIDNPNGRPRAEDLAAVCRSLALEDVEPPAGLHEQLLEAHAGLSAPW